MLHDPIFKQSLIALLIILAFALFGKVLLSVIELLSHRHAKRTTRQIGAMVMNALIFKILPLMETNMREKIYTELYRNGVDFPRVQRFIPLT